MMLESTELWRGPEYEQDFPLPRISNYMTKERKSIRLLEIVEGYYIVCYLTLYEVKKKRRDVNFPLSL